MPKPKSEKAPRWEYAGHERGGKVRLVRRGDSPRYYVEFPDPVTGYARRESCKTTDEAAAIALMNDVFRKLFGTKTGCFCSECGAPRSAANRPLQTIIDDYLALKAREYAADNGESPAGQEKTRRGVQTLACRLALISQFAATLPGKVFANTIDDNWIAEYRLWALTTPYLPPNARTMKKRARSTVEHAVSCLGTAYRRVGEPLGFKPEGHTQHSKTPRFRADVSTIAEMLRYCLYPRQRDGQPWDERELKLRLKQRRGLADYIRLCVLTWGRPEAVQEISFDADAGQWDSRLKVLFLNPADRTQNDKHRAMIPVPDNAVEYVNSLRGRPAEGVTLPTFKRCAVACGFPENGHGENGMKQLRRAIATEAKKRLTKLEFETQGKAMMGHSLNASVSALYAPDEPATLHRDLAEAVAASAAIVAEIEALCPGAFSGFAGAEILPFPAAVAA